MATVKVTEARRRLTELVNRVEYAGETVFIERYGRTVAALLPVADAELIRRIEDRIDAEAAAEAAKEPGSISLEDAEKELGPVDSAQGREPPDSARDRKPVEPPVERL